MLMYSLDPPIVEIDYEELMALEDPDTEMQTFIDNSIWVERLRRAAIDYEMMMRFREWANMKPEPKRRKRGKR